MLWQDVLVSRHMELPPIAMAMAVAFDVPREDVVVVNALEETPERVTPLTRVLVQRTMAGGDFPMQLSVYVLDRPVEQRLADQAVGLAHLQRLSSALGADHLFFDGTTPGDVEELLVHPQGSVERVLLKAIDLDRGEYRIARRKSLVKIPALA